MLAFYQDPNNWANIGLLLEPEFLDILHAAVCVCNRTPIKMYAGRVFAERRYIRKQNFCMIHTNLSIILVKYEVKHLSK